MVADVTLRLTVVASALVGLLACQASPTGQATVALDKEQEFDGRVLNPSTQSINRYHSRLRELDQVHVKLGRGDRLDLQLQDAAGERQIRVDGLDIHFLVPLLPYARDKVLDPFDRANLFLGEYARNGVQTSYQAANTRFASFHDANTVFDGGEEYFYRDGALQPNPAVTPNRFHVTNNCLKPGLWELAANDSVGELYHSWFEMPSDVYLEMIRRANDLDATDEVLTQTLEYRPTFDQVPLDLGRLRTAGAVLVDERPQLALDKDIGGYSNQDSRRKVQRGYFQVHREGSPLQAQTLSDLQPGDAFHVRAFVEPGIYSAKEPKVIPFEPAWDRALIREVEPHTRYPGQTPSAAELGHVEVEIHAADGSGGIVAGNVPISLLVLQEDYEIPAFGIGVLPPSEPIERRYLRLREGPAPHYAYEYEQRGDQRLVVNNHESGWEQVYLRPFERDGELFMRITLVSYERIVDLIELEVPVDGELATRIRNATSVYRPPLFRVYTDENIL